MWDSGRNDMLCVCGIVPDAGLVSQNIRRAQRLRESPRVISNDGSLSHLMGLGLAKHLETVEPSDLLETTCVIGHVSVCLMP